LNNSEKKEKGHTNYHHTSFIYLNLLTYVHALIYRLSNSPNSAALTADK